MGASPHGQGLENQSKGSSGWCQEPAEGEDGCRTPAQSWGQGDRRGLLSALSSGISEPSRFPKVMETQSLTCLHPCPHPITGQSSRNTQNSHQDREFWPPRRRLPQKQSLCESRDEGTSLPLRPHPAEQLGASWEHHPCWEQSTGCILGTGRAGRGGSLVLFLSKKASGGCLFLFFIFFFFNGFVFFSC